MREREVEARWRSWGGHHHEVLRFGWEAGGWTADGVISGLDIHYTVRLDAYWSIRHFLLFRDAEEPDLWLAHDGAGNWAEVNGASREDLIGCTDVDLGCTPFMNTLPIRRLGLAIGDSAEITNAWVDVETLAVHATRRRYTRTGERQWRFEVVDSPNASDIEVDEHGLVLDYPERFRRVLA